MKKVLIAITKSNMGGAGQYVCDLALNLPKNQFEVEVLAGGAGKLHELLKEAGIKSSSIIEMSRDIKLIQEIHSFFFLVKFLKKNKFDIIHTNSPKMGGLGSLAARIAGIPRIIYTAHGWTMLEKRPLWQKILIYIFSYLTVVFSRKTIVSTKLDEKIGKKMPFVKNKIYYLHNGLRKINFLTRKDAEEKLSLKKFEEDTPLRIVTIAELHKNKNYKLAIESVAKLYEKGANIIYYIIGEGEERNNLIKLIRELKAENYIKLQGSVENASEYLKAFDIFLLTSEKEGLPSVILEAGLAGLKIVAKDVGGIGDILNGGYGTLLKSDSPEDFAKSILKVGSEEGQSDKLKTRVEQEYSLQKFIEAIVDIYS